MLNTSDHTYTGMITGLPRRSVTTILAEENFIDKRWFREGFADIGTQGHKLLDAYDKRWKFTAPDIYLRYLEAYKAFLAHTKAKVIVSELEVEDLALGVSGTLDKLIDMPGHGVGIMDVKFSQCGYLAAHELQTQGYKSGLVFHPKYGKLKIKWRGGIILGHDCELPRLIQHDRIPGVEQVWQAICISNAAKHRYKINIPQITKQEGWIV
jgi:hypothetical protein